MNSAYEAIMSVAAETGMDASLIPITSFSTKAIYCSSLSEYPQETVFYDPSQSMTGTSKASEQPTTFCDAARPGGEYTIAEEEYIRYDDAPSLADSDGETADDSQESAVTSMDGINFRKFVASLLAINVSPEIILSQLGLHLPFKIFSRALLIEFLDELALDLTEASFPRLRLHTFSHFSSIFSMLTQAKRIVILSGAGISVSSGIPDFRSKNGIYSRLGQYNLRRPTDMFSLDFFRTNPVPFFRFCPEIVPCDRYKPTLTHLFIRVLQDKGKLLRLYTQNIDCLEMAAGISEDRIVNCHGSFAHFTCIRCGHKCKYSEIMHIVTQAGMVPLCMKCEDAPFIDMSLTDIEASGNAGGGVQEPEPVFANRGILKPDIVFFGEKMPSSFTHHIDDDCVKADLFIVIGSSLKVKPVAGLLGRLPRNVPQVLINRESVGMPHCFDLELLGSCDLISRFVIDNIGWQDDVENLISQIPCATPPVNMNLLEITTDRMDAKSFWKHSFEIKNRDWRKDMWKSRREVQNVTTWRKSSSSHDKIQPLDSIFSSNQGM